MKISPVVALIGVLAGCAAAHAADDPAGSQAAARAASAAVQQAEPAVAQPPPAAPRPRKGAARAETAAADKPAKAMDRLELETTQITGNRELPKVMVIVPWKRADIGDLVGRPVNSLVDEALQPVDREVFRREVDYFNALAPDRARSETHITGSAAGPQPEK
ncbi:MAG TPA: hypothetical protein VMU00_01270 [Steroidobacteraceae bacterium]|nr:hypothetical protein [Steroidobacteraceae bacterium]